MQITLNRCYKYKLHINALTAPTEFGHKAGDNCQYLLIFFPPKDALVNLVTRKTSDFVEKQEYIVGNCPTKKKSLKWSLK